MTDDRHTTEQAPGKPLSAPLAASTPEVGVSGGAGPLNGSQTGAHGLALRKLIAGALTHCPDTSPRDAMAGAVLDAITPHLPAHHPHTVDQAEKRLRHAHQARRAKEHQLDDIRRALCDIGFMEDDDPYSHADLADVIRQNGQTLLDAPAREAGPSVREAAAQDREYWEHKDAGEQP